jgi:hypothetical protein
MFRPVLRKPTDLDWLRQRALIHAHPERGRLVLSLQKAQRGLENVLAPRGVEVRVGVPDAVHNEGGFRVSRVYDVDLAAPHAVRACLESGREALQRPSSRGESIPDMLGVIEEPALLRNAVGMV